MLLWLVEKMRTMQEHERQERLRRATETERRRGGLFDSELGYCPNHGCVHPGERHHRDGTCSVPHCLCMARE